MRIHNSVGGVTIGCHTSPPSATGAPATGTREKVPATRTALTVEIRGGLVIVTSERDNLLHLGPLLSATPRHSCRVKPSANTHAESQTLATNHEGEYELDRRALRLVGPGLAAAGPTTLPGLRVTAELPRTEEDWNNQYLIPDIAAITKDVSGKDHTLKPGWRDLLDGRVMLAGGAITVRPPTVPAAKTALWAFKVPGRPEPVRTQAMSEELQYTAELDAPWVAFVDADKTEVLRLTPKAGSNAIGATIESSMPHTHAFTLNEGARLPHFDQFYTMLTPDVSEGEQAVPYYRRHSSVTNSPVIIEPFCAGIWLRESAEWG